MKNQSRTKSKAHANDATQRNVASKSPNQKPNAPAPPNHRCNFTTSDGRRCTLPRWKHRAFCRSHSLREDESLAPSTSAQELLSVSGEFKTYRDVNRVLGKLWEQVVKGKIARGDASTLAYIGQLLLQTLPSVRSEITSEGGTRAWQQTLQEVFAAVRASEQQTQSQQHNGATQSVTAISSDEDEDVENESSDALSSGSDEQDANAENSPQEEPATPKQAVAGKTEMEGSEVKQPEVKQPEVEQTVVEQTFVQQSVVQANVAQAGDLQMPSPTPRIQRRRDIVEVPQWQSRV